MVLVSLLTLSIAVEPGAATLEGAPDARTRLARLIEVGAIDDACGYLRSEERAALDRATRSARLDARREGLDDAQADAGTERIRRRWTTPACADPEVHGPVTRYRQAMQAWLADGEEVFTGHHRQWTARRADPEAPGWTLAQDAERGPVRARFGTVLIGGDPVMLVAVRAPQAPATVILSLRDEHRAPRAMDLTAGGVLPPPGGEVLAGLGAPSSAHKRIWATSRLRDGGRLEIEGDGAHAAFTFPLSTLEELSLLETGEGVRVDLYDASGARTGYVWIEIGALRAAMDYAAAANTAW